MARRTRAPESTSAARAENDDFLRTAVDAARCGGNILMKHLESVGSLEVSLKGRNDLVTQADREAEEAVISLIRSRYPDHAIRAEESKASPGTGAEWIIDPLDGTMNFVHRYPFFATSVAVRVENEVTAGAVYDPLRDELFTARRGGGAHLNGAAIRVSDVPTLSEALLVTGFPFRSIEALPQFLVTLESLLRKSAGVRRDGSAALDCCLVASGRLNGFWENSLSAWDIAAGGLIVEEAGGRVTDFEGDRNFLETGDIVASSPSIHADLLKEVRTGFR